VTSRLKKKAVTSPRSPKIAAATVSPLKTEH
jgi:hypothetical protein